jgi:hypothetical protein
MQSFQIPLSRQYGFLLDKLRGVYLALSAQGKLIYSSAIKRMPYHP